MKIDMSADAVTKRLRQVEALRKLCLSLAKSSAGRDVVKKHSTNETVQRTMRALGR